MTMYSMIALASFIGLSYSQSLEGFINPPSSGNGPTWYEGETHILEWNVGYSKINVVLWYDHVMPDGSSNVVRVLSNSSNSGFTDWTVPNDLDFTTGSTFCLSVFEVDPNGQETGEKIETTKFTILPGFFSSTIDYSPAAPPTIIVEATSTLLQGSTIVQYDAPADDIPSAAATSAVVSIPSSTASSAVGSSANSSANSSATSTAASTTTSAATSASTSPVISPPTPLPSPSPPTEQGELGKGTIAGISIGCTLLATQLGLWLWFWRRRRSAKSAASRPDKNAERAAWWRVGDGERQQQRPVGEGTTPVNELEVVNGRAAAHEVATRANLTELPEEREAALVDYASRVVPYHLRGYI